MHLAEKARRRKVSHRSRGNHQEKDANRKSSPFHVPPRTDHTSPAHTLQAAAAAVKTGSFAGCAGGCRSAASRIIERLHNEFERLRPDTSATIAVEVAHPGDAAQ